MVCLERVQRPAKCIIAWNGISSYVLDWLRGVNYRNLVNSGGWILVITIWAVAEDSAGWAGAQPPSHNNYTRTQQWINEITNQSLHNSSWTGIGPVCLKFSAVLIAHSPASIHACSGFQKQSRMPELGVCATLSRWVPDIAEGGASSSHMQQIAVDGWTVLIITDLSSSRVVLFPCVYACSTRSEEAASCMIIPFWCSWCVVNPKGLYEATSGWSLTYLSIDYTTTYTHQTPDNFEPITHDR